METAAIIVWTVSILIAVYGRTERGGTVLGGLGLGLGLGPLGALLAWIIPGARCPLCRKSIRCDAKICPYCRTDLASRPGPPPTAPSGKPVFDPTRLPGYTRRD